MKKLTIRKPIKNPFYEGKNSNNNKQEPYDPRKHGVSISNLNLWLTCREACRLRYVVGLRKILDRPAFLEGSLYHECMENCIGQLRETGSINYDNTWQHAKSYSAKEVAKANGSPDCAKVLQAAMDTARSIIPAHFSYHKNDAKKQWDKVEGEFSIPVDIGDKTTVPFIGKVDASFRRNKSLWLMEHKFYSRISEGKIDSLPLDPQVKAYVYAFDAEGVEYNIVRKPQLRRKQKETLKDFNARIDDDIKKRADWYFDRTQIQFTAAERKDIKQSFKLLLREYFVWWTGASRALGKKDILMNGSACEGKYGLCDYVQVCANNDLCEFRKLAR